jgi:ClpP class serine protease
MKFDMIIANAMNDVFAVEPNYANSLLESLKDYKAGKQTHTEIANEDVTYQAIGKTAVIALDGVMYKKNVGICGDVVSYDQIIQMIDKAEADENITQIVFRVDTRGGSVAGADEVRERIANSPKKTITYFENIGASGGMWIFTASDEVYASETTMLGSIGVLVMYKEPKEKVLHIVSSNAPNKVCDIADEKCKNKIQAQLDDYEALFLDRLVSAYPSKTKEQIVNDFDKGAVIFAKEAEKLGYLDGVMSFKDLLENSTATMPTQSAKIATNQQTAEIQNKGANVDLQAQLDTAIATIEANKIEIVGKDEQIATLSATLDELKTNMVDKDFVKEVIAMGGEYNATAGTLTEMIESGDTTKAENIVLKANLSQATVEAGHQDNKEGKTEEVKSKDELQELLDGES